MGSALYLARDKEDTMPGLWELLLEAVMQTHRICICPVISCLSVLGLYKCALVTKELALVPSIERYVERW